VIATTEARRIMRILSGHDAISAAITIYLSLAVIGQTTHGAIATTVPATINVIAMHGHLYSALEAGGEAYICTVGTRTPNGRASSSFERGIVRLTIQKVIDGRRTSGQILSMPYSFPKRNVEFHYTPIWPNLNRLDRGVLVLCEVLPGGVDSQASTESTGLAASEVFVLSGLSDPTTRAFRHVLELRAIHERVKLKSAIEIAASHPDRLVREYALDSAAFALAPRDADWTANLIIVHLQKAQYLVLGHDEITRSLELLREVITSVRGTAAPAMQTAVRGLASLVRTAPAEIAGSALDTLAAIISSTDGPVPFSDLSEDARANLLTALASNNAARNKAFSSASAKVVLKWLRQGR
jgi:hypothetical protein